MLETALVFDETGLLIHLHEPKGRSTTYIPDSPTLWDILWNNRARLGGVAHTHPWEGKADPSITDVTTFRAVELGLGKRLLWPIVTLSEVRFFVFNPVMECYCKIRLTYEKEPHWKANIELLLSSSRKEDQQ
jgi:hypothetical protein